MNGIKVKPFTLILLSLILIFLVSAPLFLPLKLEESERVDPLLPEKPKWTGIISLWDITNVLVGKGSHTVWLNKYISSFEKQHPGVFISLRSLTQERLAMYMHGTPDPDFMPDIVSQGIYEGLVDESLLLDIAPYFKADELERFHPLARKSVVSNGKMTGVPWMMGAYGLIVNNEHIRNTDILIKSDAIDFKTLDDLVKAMSYERKSGRRTLTYYGFTTYSSPNSKPLLGMIYQEGGKIVDSLGFTVYNEWVKNGKLIPPEMTKQTYAKAFSMLASEKRAGVMLGGSKVIYDIRRLQESGKGIDFSVYPVPVNEGLYQDQIAVYSILKGESKEKIDLCVLFLKGLLDEKVQAQLKDLGMFPVIQSETLYDEDEQMKVLEASLKKAAEGPFGSKKKSFKDLWESISN